MFKLVVLLSAAALAAAQPGLLAPGLLGAGLYGHGLGVHGLGVHGLGVHGLGVHGLGAPGLLAPGLLGHGLVAPYHGLGAPTIYAPHGGSLPHGQPANIIGADGRPLDTIDVNVDRARHLTARVVDASRLHHLLKRSLALPYAAAVSHTSRIDLPGPVVAAPLGYAAPIGVGHLGLGPWGGLGHGPWGGLGHLGLAGPFGAHW